MTKESNEDKELSQLLNLFQDAPEDEQLRKSSYQKAISQADLYEFPKHVSILTALDELFGCFALGGQFKSYYRYGTYDTCQKQREKFWFAIKHGEMTEPKHEKPLHQLSSREIERQMAVQDFFRKRWIVDKAKGSSEDVWSARKEPLDSPFRGSFNDSSK